MADPLSIGEQDGQPPITLEQLTKEHPERVRWSPKWSDYRLLYRGGDDLLRACGQLVNTRISSTLQAQVVNAVTPQAFTGQRNRRFLYQLEGEPDPNYYALWNRAFYINYLSAILDYFRHWLFSEEPTIRPAEADDAPDWWGDFYENANGSGKCFLDFVRDSFLDVLVCRRAGWIVGRNTAIAEVADDDDAVTLTPYPAEQIYDWERDSTGDLEWVVLATREMRRDFPGDRMLVETFTYLDRQQWKTWQIGRGQQFKDAQKKPNFDPAKVYEDDGLVQVGEGTHGLGIVPFVMMEIPEGLWIADKLAAPCIDIFNKQVRLTDAQLKGCIMQPYIQSGASRDDAQSRIFGENVLLHLRSADPTGGGAEDFGWKSPDTRPLEFIAAQLDRQRDEIYRIVHQMALAVDSKSIGAIARSGASKIEDRKASEIILCAYGGYVAEAMLRTANMISMIMGDNTKWTLDGFRDFNVSSLDEEVQIAALALSMGFKSKTAKQELELKALNRVLDYVDEKTRETIEQETRDAYEEEEQGAKETASAVGAAPPVPGGAAPGAAVPGQGMNGIQNMKALGLPDAEAKAAKDG